MGSRYGGLKQLDGVGPKGETIMDFSIYDAILAGFADVVFVVREKFRAEFEEKVASKFKGKIKYTIVTQEPDKLPRGFRPKTPREKPWGTGQAVLSAKDVITRPFAVINSDDFYGRESFKCLADYLGKIRKGQKGKFCMVGFYLKNTLSESGSVSRGICTLDSKDHLVKVEEHGNIRKEGRKILGENLAGVEHSLPAKTCTSMNMWGFTPDYFAKSDKLFDAFLDKNIGEPKKEFYIPYVVDRIVKNGEGSCEVLSTPSRWFGVTYKEDRPGVVAKFAELVEKGIYPSPLY